MNYETMTDRELDALVAEKVMGFSPKSVAPKLWFSPSNDVADAFRVVEAMRERGFEVSLDSDNYYNVWDCEFHKDDATYMNGDESLPRAICFAALRACE